MSITGRVKSHLYINCCETKVLILYRPLVKSAYQKIIYLFLNQNICCGCSKEPFHCGYSKELSQNHQNETVLLSTKNMGKKISILQFLAKKFCLSKPVDSHEISSLFNCMTMKEMHPKFGVC